MNLIAPVVPKTGGAFNFNPQYPTARYSILNTLVNIEPSKFLRISDSRTRGAKKLHQEHTKHPVLHARFFLRMVREWNGPPTSLTDSYSLEGFKRGLGRLTGLDPLSL